MAHEWSVALGEWGFLSQFESVWEGFTWSWVIPGDACDGKGEPKGFLIPWHGNSQGQPNLLMAGCSPGLVF